MECYLDNAATTQAYEDVCELVAKVMREDYGNPSSLHMTVENLTEWEKSDERRKETEFTAVVVTACIDNFFGCSLYSFKDWWTDDRLICKLDFYLSCLQDCSYSI